MNEARITLSYHRWQPPKRESSTCRLKTPERLLRGGPRGEYVDARPRRKHVRRKDVDLGPAVSAEAKKVRARKMIRELRSLGYRVELMSPTPTA